MSPNHFQQRMIAELKLQIRLYEKCLPKLASLDAEVVRAGMELFEDELAFALWLCTPAPTLGGRIPVFHLQTKVQRAKVINTLRALAHGVCL
jgi:uncharacterized protein (DUF2384 family)